MRSSGAIAPDPRHHTSPCRSCDAVDKTSASINRAERLRVRKFLRMKRLAAAARSPSAIRLCSLARVLNARADRVPVAAACRHARTSSSAYPRAFCRLSPCKQGEEWCGVALDRAALPARATPSQPPPLQAGGRSRRAALVAPHVSAGVLPAPSPARRGGLGWGSLLTLAGGNRPATLRGPLAGRKAVALLRAVSFDGIWTSKRRSASVAFNRRAHDTTRSGAAFGAPIDTATGFP